MQGYTLSGQGLRAYKLNGPWLKQVWSCSRVGKPELPSVAKAVAAVMWIYVGRTCGNVDYQQKVEEPLCTNMLWHQTTHLTQGTTGTAEVLERLMYCSILTPPTTTSCCLSFLRRLSSSHRPLYHELKKVSNRGFWWSGPSSLLASFIMMCSCFRLAACPHQRNLASKVLPSHWVWQALPGLFLLPGGDPNTDSYLHAELRAHGKGWACRKAILDYRRVYWAATWRVMNTPQVRQM